MPRKRRFKPSRKPTPVSTAAHGDDGAVPSVHSAEHHEAPRADAALDEAPPASTTAT